MSAAATAGPPPNGQESMPGDGPAGGSHASNGVKIGALGGVRGNRVFPHIDDLVAAQPDVNALAPIRTLLTEGELYAKQADTSLDFHRPDIALQEYIRASTIIVDLIPRHKDYPELKSDRGDLHRLYAGLQKRINVQHEKFEGIKELIKENNARSGVQPTRGGSSRDLKIEEQHNGEPRSGPLSGQTHNAQKQLLGPLGVPPDSGDFGTTNIIRSPSPPFEESQSTRRRPPVQPKPDALHGRAIKSNLSLDTHSVSIEKDLAARFSRLRGAGPHSPVQDPRIRTQPIGMPDAADFMTKRDPILFPSLATSNTKPRPDRPLGPRDMPKVPTAPPKPQKVPINLETPSMPKLPDAIYSPSRSLDNPANLDMLRSSSRNVFSAPGRPPTVAPTGRVLRSTTGTSDRSDHTARPYNLPNGGGSKKSLDHHLPDASTVTAQELMEYLKRGFDELSILLVDIRDREDFNDGHIMSHSIICIEPIILRNEISAEDLEQSLVLSPEAEQNLFDKRDTFDLVVYYDQSSTSSGRRVSGIHGDEMILGDFSKALYDYSYEKRLKRPPRLLVGGLDAWVDLIGIGALEATRSPNPTSKGGVKAGAQHSAGASRAWEANGLTARRKVHKIKPLSIEEQTTLEKVLKEKAAANSSDVLSYIRTTDDFFRRFPEPSAIQESMVSPSSFSDIESRNKQSRDSASADVTTPHQNGLPSMPDIPARPAPALPRKSYSGISERSEFSNSTKLTSYPFEYKETTTITADQSPYGRTPLENRGNHCYMNCIMQALKGTGMLKDYFLLWTDQVDPVPLLEGEKKAPQLMALQLSVMVRELCGGKHKTYSGNDLKTHCYRVHDWPVAERFGGSAQNDAQDFLGFIFQTLESDLNTARNKRPLIKLTSSQEEVRRRQPDIRSSFMEWQRFIHSNNSFISRNFRTLTVNTYNCRHCGFVMKGWDNALQIDLEIPERGPGTLEESLNQRFLKAETIGDYRCDNCKHMGADKQERFARCPEILIFMLRRHGFNPEKNRSYKRQSIITFPLNNLSLDPYCISLDGRGSEQLDKSFLKPFIYDCYAVVQHRGDDIKSGHYWTMVKERDAGTGGREQWFRYNDSEVRAVADIKKATMTNAESYLLFYERRRVLGKQ